MFNQSSRDGQEKILHGIEIETSLKTISTIS